MSGAPERWLTLVGSEANVVCGAVVTACSHSVCISVFKVSLACIIVISSYIVTSLHNSLH
jgi:hypothetical protein